MTQRLPRSISEPFLKVSGYLGLPPVATFAGLNAWNYTLRPGCNNLFDPDNMSALHTITGTEDEEWFYLISVSVEALGAVIIPTMLEAFEAVNMDSSKGVEDCLTKFSACVKGLEDLLGRMDEKCNPDIFYTRIRPFLAGSRNMETAGLPSGLFYEEAGGNGRYRQYRGGSNAQSSLIQFLDIVLNVEHQWSERNQDNGARKAQSTFHEVSKLWKTHNAKAYEMKRRCVHTCPANTGSSSTTSNLKQIFGNILIPTPRIRISRPHTTLQLKP